MARQNKIPRKTKAPRDSVRNFAASSTAPTERPAPVETASKPPRLVDKAEVLRRITTLLKMFSNRKRQSMKVSYF